MNKRTRRNKNKKTNNKSKKYYGGTSAPPINQPNQVNTLQPLSAPVSQKPPGILDFIGNKLSTYSGDVTGYVADKGLRLFGLERIKNEQENIDKTKNVDDKINKISDAATNAISGLTSQATEIGKDVVNVFNKGSAAIIGQVNDVLESPVVYQSVTQAASQTAKDATNLLNKFNEAANTPELKAATELALNNAANYTEIAVDAMDKPLNKAIDTLNKAGTEAASGVGSGLIKVATDMAGAVPGVGAVIDAGKALNDGSAAVGKVVEATSSSVEAIADVVEQTTENFKEGLDKLKEVENKVTQGIDDKTDIINHDGLNTFKKLNKEGDDTFNRVNESIDKFDNPLKKTSETVDAVTNGGGRKTRRKLLKHKAKSKRVRFSF
jgi:uncharacterized phage infection (PIP) family protein YhgE